MAKLASGFTADPRLSAMSQQAHSILSGAGQVQAQGAMVQRPQPRPVQAAPTSFLGNRVDQLAGAAATASAQMQALAARHAATPAAPSRDEIYAKYAAAAAKAQSEYGFQSQPDFERGNVPAGMSGEQALAYAQQYAAAHGSQWSPHNIAQEGQITYQNGKPGIMVKYSTPAGSSTEWTPLG